MPLAGAAERYGAPFWTIHRGDLQSALATARRRSPGVTLKLGLRAEDFISHPNGITVLTHGQRGTMDEHGTAFIAADGLWSRARERLGDEALHVFPDASPGGAWCRRGWLRRNSARR